MRLVAKRDANEPEIIAALLAVGASVDQVSEKGQPDLDVGFRDVNYRIEVKNGKYAKLSKGQQEWFDNWRGQKAVVWTVEEALRVIGAIE